jgi:hypothetical protein
MQHARAAQAESGRAEGDQQNGHDQNATAAALRGVSVGRFGSVQV